MSLAVLRCRCGVAGAALPVRRFRCGRVLKLDPYQKTTYKLTDESSVYSFLSLLLILMSIKNSAEDALKTVDVSKVNHLLKQTQSMCSAHLFSDWRTHHRNCDYLVPLELKFCPPVSFEP